jgi:hypothetical protein
MGEEIFGAYGTYGGRDIWCIWDVCGKRYLVHMGRMGEEIFGAYRTYGGRDMPAEFWCRSLREK